MMNHRKLGTKVIVFFATATLFLILTFFSNTILAAYDVTSVRPSAAMNPILGIAYGWPAILGCTVGNFISDIVSGYGIMVALLGFIPQIIYGMLPYYAWHKFIGCESHITRLDSPKVTLCFAGLMALNSIIIGINVGGIQYYVSANNFWNSAFFAFLNDFDMCIIFGLPMMTLIDYFYSRFRHKRKRHISLNEKIIIGSTCVQIFVSTLIATIVIINRSGEPIATKWKEIFLYCGYAVNIIIIISVIVMYFFRYLKKKKKSGLKIFEHTNGTIYVDEKRHLEFVSYPSKALEYRVKSDAMSFSYENAKKHIRSSYENTWRVLLSNQKGCPMKCTFCDCPGYGFYGNTTVEDLEYQIDTIVNNTDSTHTKLFEIDFMRMGEPTLNPDINKFIEFSLCNHIESKVDAAVIYPSLSTMMPRNKNVANYLQEYCRIKNNVYNGNAALQISINSTDEILRKKMFRNLSMSIEEIAEIASTLPVPKGRKYALNFAITKDSVIDAKFINRLFDKEKFLIKMTPIHQTFNAIDNGFNITTEYSSFDVFERFEKEFIELGWDVMSFLDSAEEEDDALTCGNLLLSNIT